MYKIRKQLPFYSDEEKIEEFYRRQEEKEAQRLAREEEDGNFDWFERVCVLMMCRRRPAAIQIWFWI